MKKGNGGKMQAFRKKKKRGRKAKATKSLKTDGKLLHFAISLKKIKQREEDALDAMQEVIDFMSSPNIPNLLKLELQELLRQLKQKHNISGDVW